MAQNQWYATAFAGHPYARPANGTEATVGKIAGADLEAYRKRVFAKDTLKVVAVGDITPEQLGKLLDEVFGDLPAKAELSPVVEDRARHRRQQKSIDMDVPQSVAVFGLGAMARKDPDFMTGVRAQPDPRRRRLCLQADGGGAREARPRLLGLHLHPALPARLDPLGRRRDQNDVMGQSLDIIRDELKKMAETARRAAGRSRQRQELSHRLLSRCASTPTPRSPRQLLGLLQDGFGPDYVDNRNALIEAVTLDDAKRVAKRLLDDENLIVTIVGKPTLVQAKKG